MRGIVISLLLLAGTARAQSIFPAGGEVPPTPTIWITAAEMPAISVRSKGVPVLFDVDEMNVVGGVHRIAITPQLDQGSELTVTAGKTTAKFTVVDGDAHGEAAKYNEIDFHVERISMASDALVIDAIAKRGAIMYLLDQNRDYEADSKYLWVGGGSERSASKVELPGGSPFPAQHRRFVIPLAWFGASCASQKTIEFSPYIQQMTGGASLWPIAKLQIDRGRVRMPLELVGKFEPGDELDQRAWLPCSSAKVDGGPIETSEVKDNEPLREPMKDEPAPYCPHTGEPWVKFEPTNDKTLPEQTDDTVACFQVLIVLFGALAVMWRATAKIDA